MDDTITIGGKKCSSHNVEIITIAMFLINPKHHISWRPSSGWNDIIMLIKLIMMSEL